MTAARCRGRATARWRQSPPTGRSDVSCGVSSGKRVLASAIVSGRADAFVNVGERRFERRENRVGLISRIAKNDSRPHFLLRSRDVSTPAAAGARARTPEQTAAIPWYRQVTREQWRAFWAVFLGWIVDSFDFNILAFILIDIQRSFTVDRAAVGLLGTVTLMMRLVGGTIAGTASDRWGRKLPLMLSVLWFSIFAFLSGFSTSYAML